MTTKTIDSVLEDASNFVSSEFKINIVKSKLRLYNNYNWNSFRDINNLDEFSFGVYFPVSNNAYVNVERPDFIPTIFHELYGHGLFCEYSKIGQELDKLSKNGLDATPFLFEKVDYSKQICGLTTFNIQNYEGFAVWMEALISKETGNLNLWDLKKNNMHKDYLNLFELFSYYESKMTRLGLMGQMGMPKYYSPDDVSNLVKKFYGSKLNNVHFALLRGSQKPYSDIDLFVVSDEKSHNFFNGWLDIYSINKNEFESLVNKLDISITDPLVEGTLIYGNKNYFEQSKKKMYDLPIDQKAISHQLGKVERLKKLVVYTDHEEISRKKYIDSFSWNAQQLKKGNKPLTLKNLKQIYLKNS